MITLINPTNFRLSIVCATLGERPLKIEGIRQEQGLEEYEIKFLELIEQVTNGSQIDISKSGTQLKYYPGIITNNEENEIVFDCGNDRGITYFLEPILILALFGKSALRLTLRGITNGDIDQSVDNFINCTIPLIKKFDIQEEISVKITKRGFLPNGGGEIKVVCSYIKFLRSVNLVDPGLFKRIRGVAYAGKVAIQSVNRIVSGAREILNDYIPDVWVYSDFCKGAKAGNSPGYGISLVAETTNGFFISVDEILEQNNNKSKEDNLPENIGKNCAIRLLDEIMYCGCVDSSNQSIILTLMALSEKSVSKVLIGRLTSYSIETLRTLRAFFGVTFKIEAYEGQLQQQQINENEEEKEQNIDIESQNNEIDEQNIQNEKIEEEEEEVKEAKPMIFSCLGINLVNISRKVN